MQDVMNALTSVGRRKRPRWELDDRERDGEIRVGSRFDQDGDRRSQVDLGDWFGN